jgi:hypothetical protein
VSIELGDGVAVRVAPPALPTVTVAPPGPATVHVLPVVGPPGATGPQGEDGAAHLVTWYEGHGPPPPVIPGSSPGDMYHDLDGHTFHQLR